MPCASYAVAVVVATTSSSYRSCVHGDSAMFLPMQADLAAKYVVIFQNYGNDLEAVQKLYEKHKHAPPVVRNAPPVAGNIMWARQLLRRIEIPMKR